MGDTEPLKTTPKPQDPDQVSLAAPATITVTLPANAKLSIDGMATTSTSTRRTFVSPALERGKTYSYTLEASVTRSGKPVTWSQKVSVRAGQESRVNLTPPVATGVASR